MNIKLSCGKGNELSREDKELVRSLINEYLILVERNLKEIISFDVHIKCFQKKGNLKRFYINARLIVPKHEFDVSSENWILQDAVKDAMQRLLNEIEHKCHASDSHGVGRRGKC